LSFGSPTSRTWLVLPAAGGPGHVRDATAREKDAWRQATLRRTVIASAFGLPSVSVPTGSSPPEGVALIGPPGSDHALLRAAARGIRDDLTTADRVLAAVPRMTLLEFRPWNRDKTTALLVSTSTKRNGRGQRGLWCGVTGSRGPA